MIDAESPGKDDLRAEASFAPDESDGPSNSLEPIERVRSWEKFWKTRAAVLKKLPLYDFSGVRLEREAYLGAWEFNRVQSAIAAFPGTVFAALAFVFTEPKTPSSAVEKLQDLSGPIMVPVFWMFAAFFVGRVSLRKEDSTKAVRNRASRIFLYLDGAYGFYPQLLMSCVVAFLPRFVTPDPISSPSGVSWILMFFFMGLGLWQLLIYLIFMQEDFFQAPGYRTAGLTDPRPRPPTWKYRFAVMVMMPLIGVTLGLAFDAIDGLLGSLIESS
jgi:hypothetical protein